MNMNLKRILSLIIGLILVISGLLSLNSLNTDLTVISFISIGIGLIFLGIGIFYKSREFYSDSTFGGYCKSCGDWCDLIVDNTNECCHCAGESDYKDWCITCREKELEIMS